MSHRGTMPVNPGLTAFENCIAGVEKADIVLGIINGRYGSGIDGDEPSITHKEILKAIELGKPRYLVAHRDVVTARHLLKQFRKEADGTPRHHTFFKKTPVIDDIRVIDLYDDATLADRPISERQGNWVQQFSDDTSLLEYIESQFSEVSRFQHPTTTSEVTQAHE